MVPKILSSSFNVCASKRPYVFGSTSFSLSFSPSMAFMASFSAFPMSDPSGNSAAPETAPSRARRRPPPHGSPPSPRPRAAASSSPAAPRPARSACPRTSKKSARGPASSTPTAGALHWSRAGRPRLRGASRNRRGGDRAAFYPIHPRSVSPLARFL
jgi:hypothetical protein